MVKYEPELMFALDAKSEFADWKNIHNVSGDDVLYCPICLGRVKLWNGQNPNKIYKKQKCFHHIDQMCSNEKRIHFAYKTWLLKKGSKIKIKDTVYEVASVDIEKVFHTKFGNYRPDITIEVNTGKVFYVEIANTNKKTDNYVGKWDELGRDVLELDVNEQLTTTMTSGIPEFNLIYSATTGECFSRHYCSDEYIQIIAARKNYWTRQHIMNRKVQWERLDWFWRQVQYYYLSKCTLDDVLESFIALEPLDQKFICSKMRGKHSNLRIELENHYTNIQMRKDSQHRRIDKIIRQLNMEFELSKGNGCPVLCREANRVKFHMFDNQFIFYSIEESTTTNDVFDYFYDYISNYMISLTSDQKKYIEHIKVLRTVYEPIVKYYITKINNCKNGQWSAIYTRSQELYDVVKISLFGDNLIFHINPSCNLDENSVQEYIVGQFVYNMKSLIGKLKDSNIMMDLRIMEER